MKSKNNISVIFHTKLLTACLLAMTLAGCGNSDDSPTTAKNVIGEGRPVIPNIPDKPQQASVVGSDVAVYGKVDKDKFNEIALDDGKSILVLDDDTQEGSYAAMGLSLPKLTADSTDEYLAAQNYARSVMNQPIIYNYANTTVAGNDNKKQTSDMLQTQVRRYLKIIESVLEKNGATVNTLVDQEIINSQSTVVQIVWDVNFTNSQQSPSYVRNLVLSIFNNGKLPQGLSVSSLENGNKLRLNLSFWQDQNQVLLWAGSYLADKAPIISKKYGDFNNATALSSVRATTTKAQKESFKQKDGNAGGVDILWSIDASGSMSEEQQNLANGAEQFFNTLSSAGIDYRLAVHTQGTDGSRYKCTGLREISTGDKYIDNKTTNALDEWRNLARPGTGDSGTETGFYCNREVDLTGFDRPDAKNLVVFVSDESENETVQGSRPSATQYGYQPRDFTDYKQYFTNTGATYFAITGTGTVVKPTLDSYVDLNANGDYSCNGQGGRAVGGAHFKEIAKLTGGSSASICADATDWSVMFEQILKTATGLASNFKLKHSPIPSTVKVLVDGKSIVRDVTHQNGFDLVYGQSDVSLAFYGDSLPKQGSMIAVSYDYIGNRTRVLN